MQDTAWRYVRLVGKNTALDPLVGELRRRKCDLSLLAGELVPKHTGRITDRFLDIVKYIATGLKLGWLSKRNLTKETIIIFDHHLALSGWVAAVLLGKKPRHPVFLVLKGFIHTPRNSAATTMIRKIYLTFLLKRVHLVTCYSEFEKTAVKHLTQKGQAEIATVRYGIGQGDVIARWYEGITATSSPTKEPGESIKILSAGRSSRDYLTLTKAMSLLLETSELDFQCDIICDHCITAPDNLQSSQVTIHRSIFGSDYTGMITQADVVIVPLNDCSISAGQMVMLHALAAGKPLIVSDTPTTREYLRPDKFCRLVPMNDEKALAVAILETAHQLPLSVEEVRAIRTVYEDQYSDHIHAKNFYRTIKQHVSPAASVSSKKQSSP